MTAEQWRQVRDLFDRALDQAPDDPIGWARREAADPMVAAEAASLLAHHAHAGLFLSDPIASRVPDILDSAPRLSEGTAVGPYSIVREIGRGGMGHVYLARDSRLGRTVALKALPPSLTADEHQRERLRREARAAALLTHPGICTVYALEEIDGDLFIASEYVDGLSLRSIIASGARPSASDLERVTRDLTQALASAHERGITHRDLKPENVMQTHDGRLKILDFGLALMNDDAPGEARMTRPGAVIGTPGYMAPEQLNGHRADPRSDLFALGVLLTEYATGVHPFDAATPIAMAARVLETQVRPLSTVRPDVPLRLAAAIDCCLRKDPAERPADARAFLRLLDAGEAASAAASHDPVTTWWRRHQAAMIGLYVVAAALAWQIKEWTGGMPRASFIVVGVFATVAGIFRGHLLFAEQVNRRSFAAERRRAAPVTLATDVIIALALTVDGLLIANERQVAGVLALALAVGLALARVVVERATSRGAFGDAEP